MKRNMLYGQSAGSVIFFLSFICMSSADEASSHNTSSNTLPETGTIILKLDELQAAALHSNPSLQAVRAKWEAMQERPAQAGSLPNPMLIYRGMDTARSSSFSDTNEKRFELEQSFPWFGKRDLLGKLAEKDAEVMKSEFESMARETIMMVKETYYGLYAVQKAFSITRGEEALLKQIEKTAGTKYSTGESSQQDILKAQSEITMISQRLLELEARETTLKAKLNTLLNRKPDSPLGSAEEGPAVEIENKLQKLLDLAGKSRPEIRGAQTQIERSKAERKLMGKEYFPDMKLGAEYRAFRDESEDMAMFMVGMEIPIWQGKYRAGAREADKMIESGKANLAAVEKQTAFDVKDSHFRLLTAKKTIDLYANTLVPQAKMRFKASEAAYRTGKADFMDLLESERFLLNAKIMLAMAEGDLGMQMARLERAVGTDLKSPQKEKEVQNAK